MVLWVLMAGTGLTSWQKLLQKTDWIELPASDADEAFNDPSEKENAAENTKGVNDALLDHAFIFQALSRSFFPVNCGASYLPNLVCAEIHLATPPPEGA